LVPLYLACISSGLITAGPSALSLSLSLSLTLCLSVCLSGQIESEVKINRVELEREPADGEIERETKGV